MSEGPTEKQQAYIEYLSGARHWWYAMAEYLAVSPREEEEDES